MQRVATCGQQRHRENECVRDVRPHPQAGSFETATSFFLLFQIAPSPPPPRLESRKRLLIDRSGSRKQVVSAGTLAASTPVAPTATDARAGFRNAVRLLSLRKPSGEVPRRLNWRRIPCHPGGQRRGPMQPRRPVRSDQSQGRRRPEKKWAHLSCSRTRGMVTEPSRNAPAASAIVGAIRSVESLAECSAGAPSQATRTAADHQAAR